MKSRILRRVSALLMAAVITVTLSACGAAFADLVTGFAKAATHMSGETNIRSEMTFRIKFSDDAKPVALTDLVNQIIGMSGLNLYASGTDYSVENMMALPGDPFLGGSGDAAQELLMGIELGFSLTTELYENTAMISLGWLGANGKNEPLITLIVTEDALYVGAEMLQYLGGIDAFSAYSGILSMFSFDYIKIDAAYLSDLMGMYAGLNLDLDQQYDVQDSIQSVTDTFGDVLLEYTPKVLTEEYKDVLTRNGDTYTLSLNADSALALLKEILNLAAEYDQEIMDFIHEIGGDYGLDSSVFSASDLKNGIDEALLMMDELSPGVDIPDFNFVYKVSATGTESGKKQTDSFLFTLPGDGVNMPFEKLTMRFDSTTSMTTKPVAAPTENVVSLDDLYSMFAGSLMGGFSF